MGGYLLRRFLQMILVVLLATMAIYTILNLAPGGPMAGLNQIGDRKARFSEADKERLKAYLGLDKPLALRYLVWLLGDDWLGANYMHVGLERAAGLRFYATPGIAYARGGYPIWVIGEKTGTNADGLAVIEAAKVWIRPKGEAPEGVIKAAIIETTGHMMRVDVTSDPLDALIMTSPDTVWEAPTVDERPEGHWVSVSWLFGPYGLLGKYAHFHGTGRGVLRLDFGTSWSVAKGQAISGIIESRLANTITLIATSTILSLLVAIPVGIFSAVKQYSKLDYVVTTFTFFGTAMPVFWLGLMLILIFSIKFQEWGIPYLPAGGVTSVRTPPPDSLLRALNVQPGDAADRIIHMILPTITLSLLNMAGWSRYMRSSMLEVLRQDYVRTARAKGLAERLVIVKHAMRNALIPIVTIVVFTIPSLFGGATITETIFSWQGMGRLYYDALGKDDWPLVMVVLFINSVLTVVATLVADILYTVVDPRIRYS
ncbi:MAG TPA: ABC transporter permease [Anaerolineae bacterium]|nr:ABC transporter permease [Anaerolineae bacterium]HQH39690.1 ABC transporter permease [Anaerolineae bacterium]